MAGMQSPDPGFPEDAGVEEEVPQEVTAVEGARVLGNEARERLHGLGFNDDEIDRWADTFMVEVGGGEPDDLIAWIASKEREHRVSHRPA